MSKVWVRRGVLMSHTNQINETQSDENECSVNDLDSANETVSGKYIYRLIKPVQYIETCVRAFVHLINVFCHCISHFTYTHTERKREWDPIDWYDSITIEFAQM